MEQVARMEKMRSACVIQVGKAQVKKLLGRPRHRW